MQTVPNIIAIRDAVIAAGESAGYWTALPAREWPHGPAPWRDVLVSDGLRFSIRAGDGKISAAVSIISNGKHESDGIRITTSDVTSRHNATDPVPPEAACSATRDPATIAKDLHKRVTGHADGIAIATAMRDRLAERVKQRAQLLAHVEALGKLGFRVAQANTLSDSTYWDARMYGPKGLAVNITAHGSVHVDRITVAVENAAALIALVSA